MVADWALHLFRKQQPDFFAVVLRITDVYAHLAWRFARAELEGLVADVRLRNLMHEDEAVRAAALQQIEGVDAVIAQAVLPAYKLADEFVGAIVASMDPSSILMIVSDHGFSWNGAATVTTQTGGPRIPKRLRLVSSSHEGSGRDSRPN